MKAINNFENTKPVKTIDEFESQFKNQLHDYYSTNFPTLKYPMVKVTKGPKFYKIIVGTSVWGFLVRYPFVHKGIPVKKGDLMMPASFSSAAKHPRGNVIEGTANYGPFGVGYLK